MKQFTSIQEWNASKPSAEEVKRVLELINRNVKSEMKRELYKKQAELRKLNRLVTELNEIGLKPTKELTDKFQAKSREIESLNLEIGVPEKKTPKKEVTKEEPTQPVE